MHKRCSFKRENAESILQKGAKIPYSQGQGSPRRTIELSEAQPKALVNFMKYYMF